MDGWFYTNPKRVFSFGSHRRKERGVIEAGKI
jgi:hypothetical protein